MRFWNKDEAMHLVPWRDLRGEPVHDGETSIAEHRHRLRVRYSERPWSSLPFLLNATFDALGPPGDWYLLWLDQGPAMWSGADEHLYYRLRQSYGDRRLLSEAPYHCFHRYETADIGSFVRLAVGNLWDAHVLTEYDYGRLFISHSEWLEFSSTNATAISSLQRVLTEHSIVVEQQ